MWDSCCTRLKLDYWETKHLHVGDVVTSEDIASGGHVWRVNCYPRGCCDDGAAKYVSLFLELRSPLPEGSAGVKVIFDAFLLDRDDDPSLNISDRTTKVFSPGDDHQDHELGCAGWPEFAKRRVLEDHYVAADGRLTIVCVVVVVGGDDGAIAIPVPPSTMATDIAGLLATTADGAGAGSDVSFSVGGEAIPAHRAVLAARSPVFRAELFGPMADAASPCIALRDIAPATFRHMLRFVYTDALPGDAELGDCQAEATRHLLAAADRFALDRLKLMCAQKLWEKVTPETCVSTLALAETYNCPELKKKCIDYFAAEANLRKVIFTDGFLWMMQEFPSLVAELKTSVGHERDATRAA